jgi:hypothetical protein
LWRGPLPPYDEKISFLMLTSEPVPVEPTVPVKRGRGRPKSKKNSQELQSSSKSKRKSVYKKQPPVLQCPDSVHENDDLELNYLATEKVLNKPKISQVSRHRLLTMLYFMRQRTLMMPHYNPVGRALEDATGFSYTQSRSRS